MPPSSNNFSNNNNLNRDINRINSVPPTPPTPTPMPAPMPRPTPPPPPPQPPVMPQQPFIQKLVTPQPFQPQQQPFRPQPIQPQPAVMPQTPPQQPINNVPTYNIPSSGGSKKIKIIVGIIIALIVIVGGGIALAATGIINIPISIPFLSGVPYNKAHVLIGIEKGLANIQSSSYAVNIGLHTKPKEADAEIMPDSATDYGSMLPENIDVTGQITGATQKTADNVNGLVSSSLSVNAGNFTMDFAAEMRKVNEDFYVTLTKFPSLIPGLESIRSKWVKIMPSDLAQNGDTATSVSTAYKQYEENNKLAIEYFKIFMEVADKDQLITVKGNPVKEKVGDKTAYRYDLQINRKALPAVYKDFTSALKAKYGDKSPFTYDEKAFSDIDSPENVKNFEYINRNVTLSVWADSNGVPIKYSFGMRYLPNTPTPSKTQLNMLVSLVLNDINKTITIEAPADAISFDDAYTLVTGETKEQRDSKGKDAAIKVSVSSIRAKAEIYYVSNNNSYANICKGTEFSGFTDNIVGQKGPNQKAGITCYSSKTAYVIAVTLNTPNKSFCVDSTGTAIEGTANKTTLKCK